MFVEHRLQLFRVVFINIHDWYLDCVDRGPWKNSYAEVVSLTEVECFSTHGKHVRPPIDGDLNVQSVAIDDIRVIAVPNELVWKIPCGPKSASDQGTWHNGEMPRAQNGSVSENNLGFPSTVSYKLPLESEEP